MNQKQVLGFQNSVIQRYQAGNLAFETLILYIMVATVLEP